MTGGFDHVFGTDGEVLLAAVAARRAAAAAHAAELEALAEYARRHPDDGFAHLEVAPLLHISDGAAHARLQFARDLTEGLPRTFTLVRQGELEEYKANLIVKTVRYLTEAHAHQVEALVLPKAPSQTSAQLQAALAKAVIQVDPEGAEERRQRRKADRRVSSQRLDAGEAVLSIFHSPATIAALRAAIRGRALQLKNAGDEPRTLTQLEADVAADLLLGSEEHCRVHVHLTLPVAENVPAEVDGIGAITRQEAFDLAAEASTWRWLRTNPTTGVVEDITAASSRPPALLAEFIKVRDRTCRHPGCTRPARTSDLDHRRPWPHGKTSTSNLDAGCRRHHRAKTHAGWLVTKLASGALKWTSPLGFQHHVPPTPIIEPASDPPPF